MLYFKNNKITSQYQKDEVPLYDNQFFILGSVIIVLEFLTQVVYELPYESYLSGTDWLLLHITTGNQRVQNNVTCRKVSSNNYGCG